VTTKASFTVWNENETKLTGLDQCITCWDERLFTSYGIPNHFLRENLQTDKGKAQIDGLQSQLCDVDYDEGDGLALGADPRDVVSQAAALLGVASKQLGFLDIVVQVPQANDMDVAGTNLIGMGEESAVIRADLLGSTPPERPDDVVGPVQSPDIIVKKKSATPDQSAGR